MDVVSKIFEMKCQTIDVRGIKYFICGYTGAPIDKRYFVPAGRYNRGKQYCCASLPVLLRLIYEEEENTVSPRFLEIKKTLEEFYNQPDIPLQPELSPEKVPLSRAELFDYLLEMDQGEAWLLVAGAQEISGEPSNKKIKL